MKTRIVICDLDNTLYNWVDFFVPSIKAMAEAASSILKVSADTILDELKDVHKKYGTVERPYSLLDIKSIERVYKNVDRAEVAKNLDPAFHAFNSARKELLELYPTVKDSLQLLKNNSVRIVGFTDANALAVLDRVHRLTLSQLLDRVYCSARPRTTPPFDLRNGQAFSEESQRILVELDGHARKPNPTALTEILNREGVERSEVIYVGDSLHRDIMMANDAGVYSAWAEYGGRHSGEYLETLIRISHWTDEEIEEEVRLKRSAAIKEVKPDLVLSEHFSELLGVILT